MYAVAYHEILKEELRSILKDGLKASSGGDKTDKNISKADNLLDTNCPEKLKQAGLSRSNNLYCYLAFEGGIVDITSGKIKLPGEISKSPEHKLLKVKVDPTRCYVSDLDLYDQILNLVKYNVNDKALDLNTNYWQRITRLDRYDHERGFRRPEIMVTYDVPGYQLEIVKS
jgi:hypothetical protein